MTKLRRDEYKYKCTIDYIKQITQLEKDKKVL